MRKMMLWLVALTTLSVSTLCAQDIAGTWQGTLQAGKGLRTVLNISAAEKGGWTAMFYSIDQGPDGIAVSSISLQGSAMKFSIAMIQGSYQGELSADGKSISGTWTQSGTSFPLNFQRATKETAWSLDTSPHTVQFITVDKDVKLEVLDWGGTGRPVVLLAGLGNTAHVFDQFAPKLMASYHVYGITRRGFGASSAPAPIARNYSADRLGDDVLAVIAALKLNRPVLVGHSIAGEELSSIGSRYPEKVAGLIYLDAGYGYAYYDRSRGDLTIDSLDLRKNLDQLIAMPGPRALKPVVQETLQTSLPRIQKDLQELQKELQTLPDKSPAATTTPETPQMPRAAQAIIDGEEKYTEIKCPVLAIFAVPHNFGPMFKEDPAERTVAETMDLDRTTAQSAAFQAGVPSARVVRLPHANHYVFKSNEADVLRELKAFIDGLPPAT
ncbi:MAG: alpha/beta hydrolase [Acidobacteriaceae bacterium]